MPPESGPAMFRILVVDDHAVVRSGLRAVLADEEGLEVIGEASDARGAVARALTLRPDVILMDVRMGPGDDRSGIEACREIRSTLPATKVIMFTSFGERESVLASILAGATGFLTKNVSQAKLVEAIRAAGRGDAILDPTITREVLDKLTQLAEAPHHEDELLSGREREILTLMARGYTNPEIAAELIISPFTARNHVTRILDKLGVSRRSEAAALAVRMGLLGDGEPPAR